MVLPPAVLGVWPDRPGVVSRGGSGWRPRDRYRLLLRRAGPRAARPFGAWLAKPVSLLNGITGRRQPADERAWLRVGGLTVTGGQENRRNTQNYSQSPDLLFNTQMPLRSPNSLRIERASSVPSAPRCAGQSGGRAGGASDAASSRM